MGIEKLLLKAMLALPRPLLLKLAGGTPLEIDGRTMELPLQFMNHMARSRPGIETATPQAARGATRSMAWLAGKRAKGVQSTDMKVPAPHGSIPVRLYEHDTPVEKNASITVFFHFGGGVIGDMDTCDAFCSMLVHKSHKVLSVDYRLAPEHPFPAAVEDACSVYRWLLEQGDKLGVDIKKIVVGGDSMGGNLAAVLCQQMHRDGVALPCLQLLIYPWTDLNATTGSMVSCAHCAPLTKDLIQWFRGHYLGAMNLDAPHDSRLSPFGNAVEGLPAAIVITAGFDVLRDQGKAYADKLEKAGVATTYRCYDSLVHGFTAFMGVSPMSKKACENIVAFVHEKLGIA